MTLILSFLLACSGSSKDDTGAPDDTAGDDTAGDTEPPPDLVTDCTTTACGGDPSGDWTAVGTCFSDEPGSMNSEDCPSGTIQILDLRIESTASIAADGTYTRAMTLFEADALAHVPDDCTSGLSCDIVQSFIEEKLPGIECVDASDGDGCDCTVTIVGDPEVEAGTWSTVDTTLTTTPDDGSGASDTPYCADHDELWLDMETDLGSVSLLFTRDAG